MTEHLPTPEAPDEHWSKKIALAQMAGNTVLAEECFREWEQVTTESDGYIIDD